jgi:DNA-binding transcriptional MerR regulator
VTATYELPVFSLKAVVQETGIKPSTLRAWERRYGLPRPNRTEGGHRLYSQRDIDLINWLLDRQGEGIRIGRAVELWRDLEKAGRGPARAVQRSRTEAASGTIADLRQSWIAACLAFDEQRAEEVMSHAFSLLSPEVVVQEVLRAGLHELGEGWCEGSVTVQQEHFASALAMRRLDALVAAAPPPTRPGRILVACPPEEEHSFASLLITFLLRRRGWDVVYLGANVPLSRLEEALARARPRLVISPAQQLHTASRLLELALFLQDQGQSLAFGGRIFNQVPALWERIPAHFLGESLEGVAEQVEQWMAAPGATPSVKGLSEAYRQALAHFRERRPHIEAQLWEDFESEDVSYGHLVMANVELANNIIAALSLGDIEFFGAYLDWVDSLCDKGRMPREMFYRYLDTYRRSVRMHLDAPGRLIVDWLDERVGQQDGKM